MFKDILNLTISSFKTVFKKRPNPIRVWIVSWILIYCIFFIVGAGFDMVGFKFYRLQYKISSEVFSHLTSTFFVLSFLSQLFAVPLLSNHLSLSDTAIVILALIPACVGFLGEALFSQVWALFLIWAVCYLLYFSISATARSAMSKLVDPTEIGKIFSVLGVLESCLGFVTKPAYGLIYQASLSFYPGLWCFVSIGWLLLALVITIALHCGTKKTEELKQELEIRQL